MESDRVNLVAILALSCITGHRELTAATTGPLHGQDVEDAVEVIRCLSGEGWVKQGNTHQALRLATPPTHGPIEAVPLNRKVEMGHEQGAFVWSCNPHAATTKHRFHHK